MLRDMEFARSQDDWAQRAARNTLPAYSRSRGGVDGHRNGTLPEDLELGVRHELAELLPAIGPLVRN